MRKLLVSGTILVAIGVIVALLVAPEAQWSGIDEAVVNKFAKDAGRPPREPYINPGQGDVLLFCFLVAGAIGGFIIGYQYRGLFPPKATSHGDSPHV
ncbi:MAG TPA: hypothetical protein VK463_05375 [Desulfomonilaceae bacterium]|nr:hypothetical protein [Desulfomonilaceae bacterium]